ARYTRLVQKRRRRSSDQRCLLGGLREDGIACRQCPGDLAGEDRERKIPRTDAGEHALAVERELVGLARRTGKPDRAFELVSCARRVVAKEINGLTQLAERVR